MKLVKVDAQGNREELLPMAQCAAEGEKCMCPVCGTPGTKETPAADGSLKCEDAVFWNRHINQWECHECWLK